MSKCILRSVSNVLGGHDVIIRHTGKHIFTHFEYTQAIEVDPLHSYTSMDIALTVYPKS